jgi:threonine dehydratase
MDPLQALNTAATALAQAKQALALSSTAAAQVAQAVAQGQVPAVNPMGLAALAGLAVSHIGEPHFAALTEKMKPLVALGSAFVSAAVPAYISTGSIQVATGYGAVAVGSAVASHFVFFKSDGFSALMSGLLGAVQGKAPEAPAASQAQPPAMRSSQS